MNRIPVSGPSITEKEIAYVSEAARTAWYAGAGKPIAKFERAFCEYLDRTYAAALPSCTAGLHLALAGLDIGSGDEVIVPDLTWIASSAPISYVGATPVFADVDPTTLCISAESVAECITERTKAILPVDLYGALPDMRAINQLAQEHNLAVIEDAAEAIGSRADGTPAGKFGTASVFSFHGSKTLTTGEGGMLLTDDPSLIERVNRLRDHGRAPGDRAFNNSEVAFKYRMSDLQAALGLAQLHRIDELLEKKRNIHHWYVDRLGSRSDLAVSSAEDHDIVWWMVSIQVDPATGWDKDRLQARLSEVGIDTRPVFRPLSSLAAYHDQPQTRIARERNKVAYRLSPYGLNLPSGFSLTEADVDRVCTELAAILDR